MYYVMFNFFLFKSTAVNAIILHSHRKKHPMTVNAVTVVTTNWPDMRMQIQSDQTDHATEIQNMCLVL